jgi:hypothetical protein
VAAAIRLPANSVGTKQLKASAVTSAKVKDGAITSRKVKDRSLLAQDFAAGQLIRGPVGPQGPQGPPGPKGEDGAVFVVSPDLVRREQSVSISATSENEATATCGTDEVPVSGGYAQPDASIVVFDDNPSVDASDVPTGWHVRAQNNAASTVDLTVYVVCAS